MAYRLIKGEFIVFNPVAPASGPQPDGDTIKFRPSNPALVEDLPRSDRPPDFNASSEINVRFEGIDALETHFEGAAQAQPLADEGRDAMLRTVGFTSFRPLPSFPSRLEHAEPHPLPGHILTRGLDSYGRIVAFVYGGVAPEMDGADLFVDIERVDRSANATLIRAGHAYPGLYRSLPADLRAHFARMGVTARDSDQGLWPAAVGEPGRAPAVVPNRAAAESVVIWPKLFRRLISYFGSFPDAGLAAFDAWLRADVVNRDDEFVLANGEHVNFHDVIEVDPAAHRITLLYAPETLTIVPDGQQAGVTPQPGVLPDPVLKIIAAVPNPRGADVGRETVTILNVTSDDRVLSGWRLANTAGAYETLSGTLAGGEARRVTLQRLSLGNRGGTITLLDDAGRTVHQERYRESDVTVGRTITFPIPGLRP